MASRSLRTPISGVCRNTPWSVDRNNFGKRWCWSSAEPCFNALFAAYYGQGDHKRHIYCSSTNDPDVIKQFAGIYHTGSMLAKITIFCDSLATSSCLVLSHALLGSLPAKMDWRASRKCTDSAKLWNFTTLWLRAQLGKLAQCKLFLIKGQCCHLVASGLASQLARFGELIGWSEQAVDRSLTTTASCVLSVQ